MLKSICIIGLLVSTTLVSFYSITVSSVSGTNIAFSQFTGKKVLVVNIASTGSGVTQISELETLYQQHKDSMDIIAIPSNSFGNEPLDNNSIIAHLQSNYNIHFTVTGKSNVHDSTGNNLVKWLQRKAENGAASCKFMRDYQKFLIDANGELVGVFDSIINPLHPQIQTAIHIN